MPMRYLLFVLKALRLASQQRLLTFLAFCQRGISWQNNSGTTIEGFGMRKRPPTASARVVAQMAPASKGG
jgi:hypothetical protein